MVEDPQSIQNEYQKMLEKKRLEALIKMKLRELLEPAAYERLMMVRASNEDLYNQVAVIIINLAENRKIAGKLTETQVLSLLTQLTSTKREPTIQFHRK